jgi:dimethylglycine catabolism A
MSQADPLLQPLRLKNLVLKNRVMSTSHAPAYVVGGLPLERYQLYHEEKAKGGLALTMFGGSSTIAPESPSAFGQVDISHDRIVPALRDFSRRIHAHGCALMVQITHMGRRTRWDVADWLVPVAPSRVREFQHRSFPKELEREELRRIVEAALLGAPTSTAAAPPTGSGSRSRCWRRCGVRSGPTSSSACACPATICGTRA